LEIISEVKVPTAILGAEIDDFAPPELLKQFEEVLNAKSGVGRSNLFVFFLNHNYMFLYIVSLYLDLYVFFSSIIM
jgi:hypothetical protein